MDATAGGTGGAVPVVDFESVFCLGPGFRVACEEPWEEGVGLGSEGVDGELPSEAPGQQVGVAADKGAADWASHVCCRSARQSAVTQSLHMMTQESDRSSSREAASKASTPPSVSRRTWCGMSSESGREPTITLPSGWAVERTRAPQPWTEESQVMTTTRAWPISPARKAA